jgi:hypothetical protein
MLRGQALSLRPVRQHDKQKAGAKEPSPENFAAWAQCVEGRLEPCSPAPRTWPQITCIPKG